MKNDDDVIREVRAAREEYCREFGFDLLAIMRDLQAQERKSERSIVSFSPRPTKQTIAHEKALNP